MAAATDAAGFPQGTGVPPGIKITHVLFDMDGLLLDTEGAYTIAQEKVLAPLGKAFTWELKAGMMGRGALEAAEWLLGRLGVGPEQMTPQQFLDQRGALLEAEFTVVPLLPGAERLVRHLAAAGVPMAVATGSGRGQFDHKTQQHRELFGLFSHVVTGDMVAKAKPDPAIFLQALATFPQAPPPDPACVLVFEDAPNGVEAALAGGLRVVMVPTSGMPPHLWSGTGANQFLPSLEDFKPEEWGLPPFPAGGK
ncbi:hypothetical protein HYH03_010468 [Edaphochlamys debaryana]|uniref:Uncharacterized protein n=1 Tax=Edaphochlamys debaryana TaxID=47281 RepID=A0A836BXI7_9CHLO|nr:hypothetical protein HYH03_010468 [Edaphochlamys debaryana]|eukprot:KAG2491263.1 hypothetical protein HYH03_010468 [Edaphochlamys debaryana]